MEEKCAYIRGRAEQKRPKQKSSREHERKRVQSFFFLFQFQAEKKLEVGRVNSLFSQGPLLYSAMYFLFFPLFRKRERERGERNQEKRSGARTSLYPLERLWWNMGRENELEREMKTLTCSIEFRGAIRLLEYETFWWLARVFRFNDATITRSLPPPFLLYFYFYFFPSHRFFTGRLSMTNGQAQQNFWTP